MQRLLWILTGLLSGLSFTGSQADDPQPPPPMTNPPVKHATISEAEISKSIGWLGSPRFRVREKASQTLWEAGRAAEPALRKAARSNDPEVAQRAKAILDRFDCGIYPDTPAVVREAIEAFRAGADSEKQEAATRLMRLGTPGLLALRKLLPRLDNAEQRLRISSRLIETARSELPVLLERGDRSAAKSLLEMCLLGNAGQAAIDYALFHFLAGTTEEAIAEYTAKWKTSPDEANRTRLAKILVRLHRSQGNWEQARQLAKEIANPLLYDAVLWEEGNWKLLSELDRPELAGGGANLPGVRLAYHRLAESTAKTEATLSDIQNEVDLNTEDPRILRLLAEALLLNAHTHSGIELLQTHRRDLGFVFELLVRQMRYQEAFALVEQARTEQVDTTERNALDLRRATALHQLGKRDAAVQIFTRLGGAVTQGQNELATELLKAEVSLGLRDLAIDQAALLANQHSQNGVRGGFRDYFEPLVGEDNVEDADVLWAELRQAHPDLSANVLLHRVLDLLEGKAGAQLEAWLGNLPQTGIRPEPVRLRTLGEVYVAAGRNAQAEAAFLEAARSSDTPQDWLRLGDFLLKQDRPREAAERYKQAWQSGRAEPLAFFLYGHALAEAGNRQEGQRLMDLSHWLPLGDMTQRAEFIRELDERGFDEAADREMAIILRAGWYNDWRVGNVLNRAARQAIRDQRFAQAADYYQRSVVGCMRTGARFIEPRAYLSVPQTVAIHRARGLLQAGKLDAAIAGIEASLKVMPGNLDLAIAVVPELDQRERQADAQRVYRRVADTYAKLCQDHPESAFAHNAVAWLAAGCRRDLDQGLEHARKAVALEPERPGYRDTLAEVHFRRGEQAQAIAEMQRCLKMDRDNRYYQRQLSRFRTGNIDSDPPEEE